jgi:hypothetical protein
MSATSMNVMAFNSITLSEEMIKRGVVKENCKILKPLEQVIYQLAIDRPLWKFVATRCYMNNEIIDFDVYHDGEKLGTLERTWFRGEHCIEVNNHRIAAQRERNSGYRTKDTNKAIATTKKMFTRKGLTEHIKDAVEQASKVIGEIQRDKGYDQRRHTHTVHQAMLAYAQGVGYEGFKQHAANISSVTTAMEASEELEVEINTLNNVARLQDNIIVVRRDGQYVVRNGKQTTIMSDNDLPMEWRGKLGMLKLVEDKHFVTEVGGRISEDVFVLLPEPNNVSQEGESNGV